MLETVKAGAKCVGVIFIFRHSSSNSVIAKMLLRDLDRFISRSKIKNANISETLRAIAQKCVGVFGKYRHLLSNSVIAKIALRDIYLLFEDNKHLILNISKKVRVSAKKCAEDVCRF